MNAAPCRRDGSDVILLVRTSPRAPYDGFDGVQDGRLRLRITAPPIDGRANRHLVKWLAGQFAVPQRDVIIEQGLSGRLKRIRIRSPGRVPDAAVLPARPGD